MNSPLDPNIKHVIKVHTFHIIDTIYKRSNPAFNKYVINILNLCNNLDEIVYITNMRILQKCFSKNFNTYKFNEPGNKFKTRLLEFTEKYPEETQQYKTMMLKYYLIK